MPIRTGAVADSVPEPQDEPGECNQPHRNEVSRAQPSPDPAKENKQYQCRMENKKETIEKRIESHPLFYLDTSYHILHELGIELAIHLNRLRNVRKDIVSRHTVFPDLCGSQISSQTVDEHAGFDGIVDG